MNDSERAHSGGEPAPRLSLEPIPDGRGEETRSRLLVDGVETPTTVDGLVIEEARATEHGTLVFTSYDCPHEELLGVYLLDSSWRVLDSLSLGAPHGGGTLHDVEWVDATTVGFRFFGGDDAWTVRAHPPRWRPQLLANTAHRPESPVRRPLASLFSPSRLCLEGSYVAVGGERVSVHS